MLVGNTVCIGRGHPNFRVCIACESILVVKIEAASELNILRIAKEYR
jgi:hypothetical protein